MKLDPLVLIKLKEAVMETGRKRVADIDWRDTTKRARISAKTESTKSTTNSNTDNDSVDHKVRKGPGGIKVKSV